MAELHDLAALEQGAAIRAGATSSEERVEHHLARIDRLSEELGAFVTVTGARALRDARIASSSGTRSDGPLAGVPTAVKDLNLTAGVRTSFGSPVFADFVPEVDD